MTKTQAKPITQQISAGALASGDAVFFPRKGKKIVERITAKYTAIGKTAAFFSDGITRTLDDGAEVAVQLADDLPELGKKEIYRFDLKTRRLSRISEAAFQTGFFELGASFEQRPARVMSCLSTVLINQIRFGATLYTSEAIYSKEREKCVI